MSIFGKNERFIDIELNFLFESDGSENNKL